MDLELFFFFFLIGIYWGVFLTLPPFSLPDLLETFTPLILLLFFSFFLFGIIMVLRVCSSLSLFCFVFPHCSIRLWWFTAFFFHWYGIRQKGALGLLEF